MLRYGFFYGPGTYYAADATVAAVERGAPGIYNVADDEPDARLAAGVRRGDRGEEAVPGPGLAGPARGKDAAAFATVLRGASNAKAKRELGWEPAHPSWRTGFAESLS